MSRVTRVLAALLLGIVVLATVAQTTVFLCGQPGKSGSPLWLTPFVTHSAMWIVSLALMLILGKGKLSAYGFRRPSPYNARIAILSGLLLGVMVTVIQALTSAKSIPGIEGLSFFQVVCFVWIYASLSEEVFVRGLIQSYLAPLARINIQLLEFRLSLPVLIGAVFFAAMHLGLLTLGMTFVEILPILVFALLLGIIAGYYREQTGSLLPAILVHLLGNAGGTIAGYLLTTLGLS